MAELDTLVTLRSISYTSIKQLLPPPPCSTQSQCLLPGAIPGLRKQVSATTSLHPSQQVLGILGQTFSFRLPLCGAGHLSRPSWSCLSLNYLRIDSFIPLQIHHGRWRFLHYTSLGSHYSTSNTVHSIALPNPLDNPQVNPSPGRLSFATHPYACRAQSLGEDPLFYRCYASYFSSTPPMHFTT